MWDLNDSPSPRRVEDESEGCYSPLDGDEDDKGKMVGSVSNSSSSAVVIEDGSDEEEGSERGLRKRSSSRIFGFPVDDFSSRSDPPVTRQFFPLEELEAGTTHVGGDGGTLNLPRAHWVGVKFCQSGPLPGGIGAGKSTTEVTQPLKKSRRGPRSRSSQYRGVTFYRRTGRWESHIWSAF